MKRLLISFAIANTLLNVIMFVLIILPRERTRRIRHALARVVQGGWIASSRLWTMIHEDLWQKGNGH
jgi:hypothetical protein